MAKFLYKTRGNSLPKGKTKVYFCCHPEDFGKYFIEISDDILEKQNCAVWYLESYDTEYDEEFFENLKQMQLFVMPVTLKFLTGQNHALEEEFHYAIKHHIPVLPLMQDAGLESLFNEKCGDIQFLDKRNDDVTAISYDKKLDQYLQTILIGDELSEKIRAAFDAYVFLSYRKRDRKYAQELMRLIHKNDFCRDIAVWYDEFLTPGEDFNASIATALKKSDLFVLAVTPNLVEEQNYIITTEYPMALEEKKPVFPVEMAETDKEALDMRFADIPDCINAYDENALSEALMGYAKHIAVKENGGTPEHKFFIGMAYLGGVDVEVDSERAVALITEAAQAGVAEAQRQLVMMYRNGVGVERNFESSVAWRERLAETLRNRNTYIKEELCEYFMAQGEAYEKIGAFQDAMSTYTKELDVLESFGENEETIYFRRLKSCLNFRMAKMFCELGKNNQALMIYDNSLKASTALYQETKSTKVLCDLFEVHLEIGNAMDSSREWDKEKAYNSALEVVNELESQVPDVRVKEYKVRALSELVAVKKRLRKREEALDLYQQILDLCRKLVKKLDTAEIKMKLADTLLSLGDMYLENGEVKQAREHFDEAEDIFNRVYCGAYQGIDVMEKLALAQEKQGVIFEITGEDKKAEERFTRSLVFRTMAAEEGPTPDNVAAMRWCYIKMGDVADDPEQTLELCVMALPKVEKFSIAAAGDTGIDGKGYGILHAEGFLRMCRILAEGGQAREAMDHAVIAKDIAGKNDYNRDLTAFLRFLRALNLLGDVYAGVGDKNNAKNQYTKVAYCIEEGVPFFYFSPEVRYEYAQALYKLCGEKKTLLNKKKMKKVVELAQELMDNQSYHIKYVKFYNLLKERNQI